MGPSHYICDALTTELSDHTKESRFNILVINLVQSVYDQTTILGNYVITWTATMETVSQIMSSGLCHPTLG